MKQPNPIVIICLVDVFVGLIFTLLSGGMLFNFFCKTGTCTITLIYIAIPILIAIACYSAAYKTYKKDPVGLKENESLFGLFLFLGCLMLFIINLHKFWSISTIFISVMMQILIRLPQTKAQFK
jgi:hypothetical protein